MNTKKLYLLVVLLIVLLVVIATSYLISYLISYYHKDMYYKFLNFILIPLYRYQTHYFTENHEKIFKPYFRGNIEVTNNKININRQSKNEYSLLDKSITNGVIEDLKNSHTVDNVIKNIVKKSLKYVHYDGKPIHYDDLLFVDVLNVPGNYFPFFHTDIEWNTFCESDGFQLWILLEEDEDIAPRGNMFIMETDIVEPGMGLKITKDKVVKTFSGSIFEKTIEEYDSLNEINPKIKYLNAKIGEVFLMNQNVLHCSDPIVYNSKRRAINLRVIYKKKDNVKLCNLNNTYSMLLKSKYDIDCHNDYCVFSKANKIKEL